jgi:hypothetical protein
MRAALFSDEEAMKASQSEENRMFKYYLSYQFAVGFHRACGSLPLEHAKKERLLRSAETMIHQFATAIRATDPKDELKHLCVALLCARDCKETLDEAGVTDQNVGLGNLTREVFSKYEVLHQRLEQICMKASECEGGQLRMLG